MNTIKKYLFALRREIDLSDSEFLEPKLKDDAVSINIKNCYWQINEKKLSNCSIAKKSFFDQYLRMKFVKSPIVEQNTFKKRAEEVKKQFNYKFRSREQNIFSNFGNIETITFNPKN
jgi:hypothetical protein